MSISYPFSVFKTPKREKGRKPLLEVVVSSYDLSRLREQEGANIYRLIAPQETEIPQGANIAFIVTHKGEWASNPLQRSVECPITNIVEPLNNQHSYPEPREQENPKRMLLIHYEVPEKSSSLQKEKKKRKY